MRTMMSAIELLAASPALYISVSVLLGLLVGSFLNVVIYRLPLMLEREWREQCAETSAEPGAAGVDAATAGRAGAPPAIPERFNLIVPRSACPACRAPISALQNIPIL